MITETQHLQATFTGKRFAKPGESQDKAIKRLTAQFKRQWSNDHRTVSSFPTFYPGKTTTRDYVLAFLGNAGARHLNLAALPSTPAPWIEGPEVTVEDCDG